MSFDAQKGFRLEPWIVEPMRGSITGPGGNVTHLEPKVMEVLLQLVSSPNQLVSRDELLNAVWSDHVAADQLLTRAISEVRRALGDDRTCPAFIETVPKRGYRLIADVLPMEDSSADSPSPPRRGRAAYPALIAASSLLAAAWLYFSDSGPPSAERQSTRQEPTGSENRASFAAPRRSIAVLPFVNVGDDPANDYFSEGLSEEIRNLLAEIPDLKVIGRLSSSSFKDNEHDIDTIGPVLGVDSVLEGSVRRSGDRVRITAGLIDVSDGSRIWGDTFERTMTDIFELQDDVAAAILDALGMHLGAYPKRRSPTNIPEAYALFLKARLALNIQDAPAAEKALRRAVELDPRFAEAFELLAHVYWTESIPGLTPAEEQVRIRDAARNALAIDPKRDFARSLFLESNSENYSLHAVIDAQVDVARKQPSNPAVLRTISWNLLICGYLSEALNVAERLVSVDPLSSIAHTRLSAALRAAGRPDDAYAALQIAHSLNPHGLDWYIGEKHLREGRDEKSIEHFVAHIEKQYGTDPRWVSELVNGIRHAESGQAYLDRQIPAIIGSMTTEDVTFLEPALNMWYLYFGYLDRYYEIIFASQPSYVTWSDAMYYVWTGTVLRDYGFTAHPRYLELADAMGFVDVWEKRGPPDYCHKTGAQWACD
jgi:TolB-like protein/DNA-binding winged helix-turn-helix (wHTH) protein